MTPTPLTSRAAGWVIFILALGAGFSVASIYYAQPLLPLMGANLHLSVEGMGLVPTLTQAGYALGILFLLPLGDRHDRRKLILVKRRAGRPVAALQPYRSAKLPADCQPAYRYGRDHGAGYRTGSRDSGSRGQAGENGGYGDDRPAAGDPAV